VVHVGLVAAQVERQASPLDPADALAIEGLGDQQQHAAVQRRQVHRRPERRLHTSSAAAVQIPV
jgi:hypothetical protein